MGTALKLLGIATITEFVKAEDKMSSPSIGVIVALNTLVRKLPQLTFVAPHYYFLVRQNTGEKEDKVEGFGSNLFG